MSFVPFVMSIDLVGDENHGNPGDRTGGNDLLVNFGNHLKTLQIIDGIDEDIRVTVFEIHMIERVLIRSGVVHDGQIVFVSIDFALILKIYTGNAR